NHQRRTTTPSNPLHYVNLPPSPITVAPPPRTKHKYSPAIPVFCATSPPSSLFLRREPPTPTAASPARFRADAPPINPAATQPPSSFPSPPSCPSPVSPASCPCFPKERVPVLELCSLYYSKNWTRGSGRTIHQTGSIKTT
ncbi:hypothetical protein SOVF_207590, partial [Spinacia oleracea]